jgi:[citrate (pro-3S)-lyase] ligase
LERLSKKWAADDISRWKRIVNEGHTLSEIFLDDGRASVAVYLTGGDENAAELLVGDLTENGVEIACFVTSARDETPYRKSNIEYTDETRLIDKTVDFIVVVPNDDFFETKMRLRSFTDAEILSLRGAVNLVFAKYVQYVRYRDFCRESGVRLCVLEWPYVTDFDDPVLYERVRRVEFSSEEYRKNPERFAELYSDIVEYSDEYIREIFADPPVIMRDGQLIHADYSSGYLNVVNGQRMTYGQPESASAGVYVIGGCMPMGLGADDRYTLPSFLQYLINDRYGSSKFSDYIVYNLGVCGADDAYHFDFVKSDMKSPKAAIAIFRADLGYPKGKEGRVSRYIKKFTAGYGLDYIDLTAALMEAEKKERTFIDISHTNHRGYRVAARKVFEGFLESWMDSRDKIAPGDGESGRVLSIRSKWNCLRHNGHSLSEFFLNINSRSVGIYRPDENSGDDAHDLARELAEAGIEVKYSEADGTYAASKLNARGEKKSGVAVDMSSREMMSLDDLVGMVWDRHFFYPEITRLFNRSGVHLCFVWWPEIEDLGLPLSLKPYENVEYPGDEIIRKNYVDYGAYLYNDIPAFSHDYLKEIFSPPRAGFAGKFVYVENGLRKTKGCPDKCEHTVYLFGGGTAFGVGAEDKFTVASLLQEHINNHAKQFGTGQLEVKNHGVRQPGIGEREIFTEKITPLFDKGIIRGGDVVLWIIDKRYSITERDRAFSYLSGFLDDYGIHIVDLTLALRLAQKNKLAYVDRRHVNHRGNKAAASKIYFDYLKDVMDGKIALPERGRHEKLSFVNDPALDDGQNEEFKEYLSYLERERVRVNGISGAIVMNCNPFTLGHRHLAERAASLTDILYVFVVEEDRSFFSFDDRYRLVSEGLKDLENVKILRSGKFIISTITFPGYFSKDSASEVAVDPSLDISLFARYIAPALGVDVRFAGSEPFDPVTRRYNGAMKETFPRHGMRFVEFERIKRGGEPISASRVRELIEKGDFEGIAALVPETTYRYICERFKSYIVLPSSEKPVSL